jgi:uncharacterized membrane-anchored protein YjiN (DUF445 family)
VRSPASARPRRQLALVVLLGAVVVALLALPVRHRWWGGWLLAIAEAGIVGGLADWFAVTAIFRRPLGLPIPHTALIPANWELMASRVGSMVGDRVLTREYLAREMAGLDLAGLLRRGAERVRREDLDTAVWRAGAWAAGELPRAAFDDLLHGLRDLAGRRPAAPVLVWALEGATREGWDRRAVAALLRSLGEAVDRPDVAQMLDELVGDLLARYRARARTASRFWLGLAERFGVVDRAKIVDALRAGLRAVAEDADHPLRRELLAAIGEVPARLRTDPALQARVEAAKAALLASAAVNDLLRDVAASLHRALVADLGATDSAVARWIVEQLDGFRRTLADDPTVAAEVDAWLKRRATELIGRHHDRLAAFIEGGILALGPEGAVRVIEEHAGDDLQFIRVNGTLVGGLAGGAIYALHLLLGWR